jgi:hypothetical protein
MGNPDAVTATASDKKNVPDDDDSIDESQLQEYREELSSLQGHAVSFDITSMGTSWLIPDTLDLLLLYIKMCMRLQLLLTPPTL